MLSTRGHSAPTHLYTIIFEPAPKTHTFMALPTRDELNLHTLKALADGHEATLDQIRKRVALSAGLGPADLSQMIPNGSMPEFNYRVGWNLTYMKNAGLVDNIGHGVWQITPRRQDLLATDPPIINRGVLRRYPEFAEWMPQKKSDQDRKRTKKIPDEFCPESEIAVEGFAQLLREANDWFRHDDSHRAADTDPTRPTELLEGIVQRMDAVMRASLLSRIQKASRRLLVHVVDDLLVRLGYASHPSKNGGAWRNDPTAPDDGTALARTVCLDALGLDNTYVQVNTDGAPMGVDKLLAFGRALDTSGAAKGILITTTHFAHGARETFAQAPGHRQIALIDGKQLVRLMMDHDIGINEVAHFRVRTIDLAYFQP